jgi:hypothetical protein
MTFEGDTSSTDQQMIPPSRLLMSSRRRRMPFDVVCRPTSTRLSRSLVRTNNPPHRSIDFLPWIRSRCTFSAKTALFTMSGNGDKFASGSSVLIDRGRAKARAYPMRVASRCKITASFSEVNLAWSSGGKISLEKRQRQTFVFDNATFDSCGAIASRPQCPMGA